MRVLIFHQYYLMPGEAGGSRFNEMARLWRQEGHRVTVVAGNVQYATGAKPAKYRWKWLAREDDEGVTVWRCHVSSLYGRGALGRAWAFLTFILSASTAALVAGRADAVIATSPPLFVVIPGWIAARLRAAPWVFEVRDLLPEGLVTLGILQRNSLTTRLMFRLEAWACRTATKINVLTPAFREDIVRRGLAPEEKVSVISNGADDDTFQPGPKNNTVRERFGWTGKFVAMYTGAHGPANDLDRLLEAAERLREHPDILLVSVGDGPERERLERETLARGIRNLCFTGAQPKSAMPEMINSADVGLAMLRATPTYKTVYPNKVFDYMACGRPVVLAIDGAARQLVCDEAQAGVFVTPEDGDCLARAILDLSRQPERCALMGERGRAWVVNNVSRKALARRYLETLTPLLSATNQRTKNSFYVRYGKRVFDLIFASAALAILSPLMLGLALASRLLLGKPVFFQQVRAGFGGRPFTLFKFRSMSDLRDASGQLLPDEQRLTGFGRFLRQTSLDELPGFWNVGKGDLSLIGPRPLPVAYTDLYSEEQAARLDVMPGVAGYAALFGRNAQSWESLFQRDAWYAQNVSLLLDLKIIFGVIRLVLSRQGIDRGGHDATSPFAEKLRRNPQSANLPTAINPRERTS
jgi:lipopolysaccharide/colanic/teichoic acid biosynthesis glycosyltransferase